MTERSSDPAIGDRLGWIAAGSDVAQVQVSTYRPKPSRRARWEEGEPSAWQVDVMLVDGDGAVLDETLGGEWDPLFGEESEPREFMKGHLATAEWANPDWVREWLDRG